MNNTIKKQIVYGIGLVLVGVMYGVFFFLALAGK